MRSFFLTVAAFLCFQPTMSFADAMRQNLDNVQLRNLENRVSALETRRDVNGMINPSARPEVKNGWDLFATIDLLVWQARENGLAVGIRTKDIEPASSIFEPQFVDAQVKNLDFEWNAGLRLGVGYNLPHDGWDISLTWLHFYTHAHRSAHSGSVPQIIPTLIYSANSAALSNTCEKLHSHWKMHLNQLDLDLGREFFVSKWLTLRPHFGLRTDWLHQKIKASYTGYIPGAFQNTSLTSKWKDEWWGIGLEGGLDTEWGIACGWSLYGNLTAAILYGFHKVSEPMVGNPGSNHLSIRNSYHISQPILDLQMGVRWDHMFCQDRFHLRLQTGWEHHVYFSQNQFMLFPGLQEIVPSRGAFVTNQGDLTMQGWTLSARLDF